MIMLSRYDSLEMRASDSTAPAITERARLLRAFCANAGACRRTETMILPQRRRKPEAIAPRGKPEAAAPGQTAARPAATAETPLAASDWPAGGCVTGLGAPRIALVRVLAASCRSVG